MYTTIHIVEVGFTQDTVPYSSEVCVKIFNPRDVHPSIYISLSIVVKNSTSPTGIVVGKSLHRRGGMYYNFYSLNALSQEQ